MDGSNVDVVNLIGGSATILMALLTIGFFIYTVRVSGRVRRSRGWTPVPGRVIKSTTREELVNNSDGPNYMAVMPDVVYEYRADGRTLQGDTIVFGVQWKTENPGPAQEVLRRYPLGSDVTVYYDPSDPRKAVLEHKAPLNRMYWGLTALFFVLTLTFAGMTLLFRTFIV